MSAPRSHRVASLLAILVVSLCQAPVVADGEPGEHPNLARPRLTQEQIQSGSLTFETIRRAGLRIFTTPFNKLDGYGDGPLDPLDTVSPGGRPSLQGNGTFLRVNGLDAQTCLECHSIVSNAVIPSVLGIGGVGGSNSNAIIMPTGIDPADLEDFDGVAGYNGRFANPPFLFGAGGVELLGLEMTADLQRLKQQAILNPGIVVPLRTKGVDFGEIVADALGRVDLSRVAGVDDDLVVKPFGRKGEFQTTRDFDVGAMQFHFGMQPVEAVGPGSDDDGDGVFDEVLVGEMSALQIFGVSSKRPVADPWTDEASKGFTIFQKIGCADCHIPEMQTISRLLPLRFPAIAADPSANIYYEIDLTREPSGFEPGDQGGVRVPLFADLKRHDMGPRLAENFALAGERFNREFTTARLWGIADTAPYLHDGRATTLTEAILMHGGEAERARDRFEQQPDKSRQALLRFLRSLRTPQEGAGALKALPGGR